MAQRCNFLHHRDPTKWKTWWELLAKINKENPGSVDFIHRLNIRNYSHHWEFKSKHHINGSLDKCILCFQPGIETESHIFNKCEIKKMIFKTLHGTDVTLEDLICLAITNHEIIRNLSLISGIIWSP